MKKSRKLMSVLLIVAMLFTLAAPAMAEGETTKISVADDRTYEVYQIFTGELHEGVLSNINWGQNGKGEGKVEQGTLDALEAVNDDEISDLNKLAVIKQFVNLSNPVGTVSKNAPLSVLPGYYLLKDVTTNVTGGQELSTFVVEIVGDVIIQPKVDDVTSFKKVDDKNDSDTSEDEVDWQDSADYDIGDAVPFKLTGIVTEKYDYYNKYYFAFHDKESEGLDFDESTVKVYVDGVKIDSGYRVVTKGMKDDCTFEIVFDDLKAIEVNGEKIVNANSVITVEYKSILNNKAKHGSEGNPNVMYLEYSNNPNWDGTGEEPTGKTPEDKVIVFTYKTVINKVDEKGNALTGAEFTLEKSINGNWTPITVETTNNGTIFTFKGLDDGLYRLKETKTPDGYNTIDDIYFEITAAHDADSPNPTLTDLGVIEKVKNIAGDLEDGEVAAFAATCTKGTGTIESDVVNNSGATLPETGGIGTTIFYVVGGALVLAAAVLLVTRRRMAE